MTGGSLGLKIQHAGGSRPLMLAGVAFRTEGIGIADFVDNGHLHKRQMELSRESISGSR